MDEEMVQNIVLVQNIVMDEELVQDVAMVEKFVKNFVMDAKIDPKVVMDLPILKIGGWNRWQPINQQLSALVHSRQAFEWDPEFGSLDSPSTVPSQEEVTSTSSRFSGSCGSDSKMLKPFGEETNPHFPSFRRQVVDVLLDQSRRRQVIVTSELEGRRFPQPHSAFPRSKAQRQTRRSGHGLGAVRRDQRHSRVQGSGNKSTRLEPQTLKLSMREKSKGGVHTFALTADVPEARRQVPIVGRDWHLLGCLVEPEKAVYVKTVGAFGVASASYQWSREVSMLGRLTQYFPGHLAETWHRLQTTTTSNRGVGNAGLPSWCSSSCVHSRESTFHGGRQLGGDTVSFGSPSVARSGPPVGLGTCRRQATST